ncbi:MAG: glycoside hydrolase, partial [Cytophagales bacterium]|nr:glycoside hydrolase [Cytophagales bacterium]
MKYWGIVFYILVSAQLAAQPVQWASTVLGFSSQVGEKKNGAIQVLGAPTALPQAGMNLGAWKPVNRTANEYIKVGFAVPKAIQQVLIAENYRSGGVLKVLLYDEKGKEHEVPRPDYVKQTQYPGIKTVTFDHPTSFLVAAIKLVVENDKNYGMEIDAIGISENLDPVPTPIKVHPYIAAHIVPENLGVQVNSKYSELLPVISPDGKSLYFSRRDDPANVNKSLADDVYYSTLSSDGKWSQAKNIGAPINNSSYNSPLSISPDGNSLLLMNLYFKDGHMEPGLSMSKRVKNGWSFPEGLRIDNYYNDNDYNEFCISHSGKVLIMTLERKDSKGSKDLYVGFRKPDGNWSEPKWMGPIVNSGDSESSPFLAADEKTLFFSSRGFPGYGNNDIFMTKRLDDTWLNWSEPENLGPAVNTTGWDAYFTIPASGEYAYLVSRQNSLGAEDIFRVKLPKELKPEPVTLIQGTVLNAKTKQPVSASIFYEKLPLGENAGLASTDPETNRFK